MKILTCKKCVIPNTKPGIVFKDGICSACLFHEKKNSFSQNIDWKKRRDEFSKLINIIKKKNVPNYHVLVPVSGGKDSITQVSRVINKGLKVLAVNVDYGIKTEIGKYNLNLISKMGADLIIFKPEQIIHKKLIKNCFLDYGDPDLMSHALLHAMPIKIAYNLKIPMVLLGENSAEEYSGAQYNSKYMTGKWFKNYALNSGLGTSVISKKYGIDKKKLKNYEIISDDKLKKINAVFCSYFFHWSSKKNLIIAKKHGFKSLIKNSEGTYRNYVGLDEKINRIHQYFKLLKFGYGRGSDHASEDIRNKNITRKVGLKLIKKYDRTLLSNYFIKDFIKHIDITKKDFLLTVNKYKNYKIWDSNNKKLTSKINYEN
jgi:N-acetyl sugar amidotransferase